VISAHDHRDQQEKKNMTSPQDLISRYFDLAPRPDADAYFRQFAADAVVEDEGQRYHGIDAIRAWRATVPRVAYGVQSVEPGGSGHDAVAEITGDFPGSPVSLRFHFELAPDGNITLLTIRP
jgi:alpha-D-ribose 1-methylphosphonate 5-triphosphate synthase subunit PhnI